MPICSFDFQGSAGQTMAGRIDLPDAPVRCWAIHAHCLTCGKDNLAAVRIARGLAAAGIGVLRFDFAGIGESGGDFAQSRFSGDVRDLLAAARAMADAGMPPSLLVGHSMGGAAALWAAADIPSVRAVATIAAPFDLRVALRHFDEAMLSEIAAQGEADVHLAGRPFRVGKDFVADLHAHDMGARVAALRKPLLILHAPRDDTVGIDHATRIFTVAHHPKSFVSLDHADHLLTRKADTDYVARLIAAWASPYLPSGLGRAG